MNAEYLPQIQGNTVDLRKKLYTILAGDEGDRSEQAIQATQNLGVSLTNAITKDKNSINIIQAQTVVSQKTINTTIEALKIIDDMQGLLSQSNPVIEIEHEPEPKRIEINDLPAIMYLLAARQVPLNSVTELIQGLYTEAIMASHPHTADVARILDRSISFTAKVRKMVKLGEHKRLLSDDSGSANEVSRRQIPEDRWQMTDGG